MQTELFFAGCGKREQNTDCRALCAPLQEQRAAVELDDLPHERQAEARAAPSVVQRGKAAEFRKRLGQRLAVMPSPLSAMVITAFCSCRVSSSRIEPPHGVYFSALESSSQMAEPRRFRSIQP